MALHIPGRNAAQSSAQNNNVNNGTLSQAATVFSGDFDEFCEKNHFDPTWRKQQKKDGTMSDNAITDVVIDGKICRIFCPLEQLDEPNLWLTVSLDGEAMRGNLSPYEKVSRKRKAEAPAE